MSSTKGGRGGAGVGWLFLHFEIILLSLLCRIRAGECLNCFKKEWDREDRIGNKNVKIGASWVKVVDPLKREWTGTILETVESFPVLVPTHLP